MPNHLQTFRDNFSCSQEAMAAALGITTKTISRWENASVPTLNPFQSIIWCTVNRYSAHLCRYAHTLLPRELIDDVRTDERERSLLIGPQAIALIMSKATKANWGVYQFFEGIPISSFMNSEMKAMLASYYDVLSDFTVSASNKQQVHLVTKDAPAGSKPPLWRKHTISAIYPLVLDMVSHPITEREFLATNPKLWLHPSARTL